MTMLVDAATRLKKSAALRELCHRLPHLPTPGERKSLQRFDALVSSQSTATADDVAAILAGWKRWWHEGRSDAIAEMAARLPADLIDNDRDLAMYAVAAAIRRDAG